MILEASALNWNYRVIQNDSGSDTVEWLSIHTVFYDEAGNIISYDQDPEYCIGKSITDLQLQLDIMKAACGLGILRRSHLDREVARCCRRSERRQHTHRSDLPVS